MASLKMLSSDRLRQGKAHAAREAAWPATFTGHSILLAGYVEQFDTLIPELTVREMLLYTAELKCPRSEPLCQKRHRVDQLLETLALTRCARTVIGNAMTRGISGGQVIIIWQIRESASFCLWIDGGCRQVSKWAIMIGECVYAMSLPVRCKILGSLPWLRCTLHDSSQHRQ